MFATDESAPTDTKENEKNKQKRMLCILRSRLNQTMQFRKRRKQITRTQPKT